MAWFVFEAVTGGYLAVGNDIDRALHSNRYTHGSTDLGPSAAVKAAQAAVTGGRATNVYYPHDADGAYWIFVNDDQGNQTSVYVNPSTAHVNAVSDPGNGVYGTALRLHANFNASQVFGVNTTTIIGWLGIAWILNLALGYAVTRRRRRALRPSRVLKRGKSRYAFNLNLHNFVGLLLIIPALAAVFTGLVYEFPSQAVSVISALAPGSVGDAGDSDAVPTSEPSADGTRATLDSVDASVRARGLTPINSITVPVGNPTGVFIVYADGGGYSPEEGVFSTRGKTTTVYVDQYTGRVISIDDPHPSVATQIAEDWTNGIHFATFGSWISRLLWVLVGLGTVVLSLTAIRMRSGLWPWSQRKGKRGVTAGAYSPDQPQESTESDPRKDLP